MGNKEDIPNIQLSGTPNLDHILIWDYKGYENQNVEGYTQLDWNRTLITTINKLSAKIHQKKKLGEVRIQY